MRKVLWLDIETSGINNYEHGILQLAGIVEIDGVVKETFDFMIRPPAAVKIDPEAVAVNNITKEQIEEFPSEAVQYAAFKRILDNYVNKFDKKDKFFMAGYNVQFDAGFLMKMFHRQGDKYMYSYFHGAKIEVSSFVAYHCMLNNLAPENFKLGTIAGMFGFTGDFHNALEDIRATKVIFDSITGRA